MDALALLCNLHADGPTTLHRLRVAGFDSLDDVARWDPGELATLLGWSEKTAGRFRREARLLAERLEEADRDTLDAPEERWDAPVSARRPPPLAERASVVFPAPSPPPAPAPVAGPVGRPLAGLSAEGLTPEIVAALARAGVLTVEDLVDGDLLEIAGLLGIGYTRLARLRFLVRRGLETLERGPGVEREIIPARPPAGDRLEAAGPFA
ncbi:MAG: helix-hairpin-helix domain-containing protein [Planctomycetota bacterium]